MKYEKLIDLSNLKVQEFKRKPTLREWKPFMEKYDCRRIAELGVFNGDNFLNMLWDGVEIAIAVDCWTEDGNPAHNDSGLKKEEKEAQYREFLSKVEGKDFVRVHQDYTEKVAACYPDGYFDLIYVDADHTYKGCYTDLVKWFPKLKKDGVMVGDDYRQGKTRREVKFGVIQAVDRFVKENRLLFSTLPAFGWVIMRK